MKDMVPIQSAGTRVYELRAHSEKIIAAYALYDRFPSRIPVTFPVALARPRVLRRWRLRTGFVGTHSRDRERCAVKLPHRPGLSTGFASQGMTT